MFQVNFNSPVPRCHMREVELKSIPVAAAPPPCMCSCHGPGHVITNLSPWDVGHITQYVDSGQGFDLPQTHLDVPWRECQKVLAGARDRDKFLATITERGKESGTSGLAASVLTPRTLEAIEARDLTRQQGSPRSQKITRVVESIEGSTHVGRITPPLSGHVAASAAASFALLPICAKAIRGSLFSVSSSSPRSVTNTNAQHSAENSVFWMLLSPGSPRLQPAPLSQPNLAGGVRRAKALPEGDLRQSQNQFTCHRVFD